MRNPYADAINIIIKMDKELEEDTKRAPYFELVDKKAESNNTIDLDAYAKGVEDGVIWQAKKMGLYGKPKGCLVKKRFENFYKYKEVIVLLQF
jgi:hypothetical protein